MNGIPDHYVDQNGNIFLSILGLLRELFLKV
jgi:hypothetical protein